jgi:hypothetical protein
MGLLIAGLWPFRFYPKNNPERIHGGNELRFDKYGFAHSNGPVFTPGGAGISLSIELLQVYLPTRDSSLTDVLNNILGMYIGARLSRSTHRILAG